MLSWAGDRKSVRHNKSRSKRPEAATTVTLDQMRALRVMLLSDKPEDVYRESSHIRDYLADLQVPRPVLRRSLMHSYLDDFRVGRNQPKRLWRGLWWSC